MSPKLKVEWTLKGATSPAIMRPCARCGSAAPFRSTGKFRLNANGSRLDAWLIYSCCTCSKTWNRPVFERTPLGKVSKQQLEALQSNDPTLAGQIARQALKGELSSRGEEDAFHLTDRRVSCRVDMHCAGLLVIRNPQRSRVRLDQVLSRLLKRSRNDVARLVEAGVLQVQGTVPRAVRRPVALETIVELHDDKGDEAGSLMECLLE